MSIFGQKRAPHQQQMVSLPLSLLAQAVPHSELLASKEEEKEKVIADAKSAVLVLSGETIARDVLQQHEAVPAAATVAALESRRSGQRRLTWLLSQLTDNTHQRIDLTVRRLERANAMRRIEETLASLQQQADFLEASLYSLEYVLRSKLQQ